PAKFHSHGGFSSHDLTGQLNKLFNEKSFGPDTRREFEHMEGVHHSIKIISFVAQRIGERLPAMGKGGLHDPAEVILLLARHERSGPRTQRHYRRGDLRPGAKTLG